MRMLYWKKKIRDVELQEVKRVLKAGGIIAFPTDTVYGLACDAYNKKAIERLFQIKNRPAYKPINVLTDSVEKMYRVVEEINHKELELISKYMPGDLTIILKKNNKVPSTLTAGIDTIGVRIPNNKVALTILQNYKNPLAVTSANISGEKSGVEVADFIDTFRNKIDIIVDGGKAEIGKVSTIVQVKEDNIKILRQDNSKWKRS